jgi:ankyrin repeat protein
VALRLLQGGWTPLHKAAAYGSKEVAGLLLDAKAIVDAATKVTGAQLPL